MIKLFRKLLFLVMIFFFTNITFPQGPLLQRGNDQYEKYEYKNAQETYLKVVDKGYRSAELLKKLGNSYYFNSQFKEASIWYRELFLFYKSEVESEYYFKYAQTLKSSGSYEEADVYMNKFAELNPEDKRAQLFLKKQDYLKEIENQSDRYSIQNLSMNSSFTDFGTAYYGRYVVFSSSKETTLSKQNIHEWNNESYLDLYIAAYDPDTGELSEIEKME